MAAVVVAAAAAAAAEISATRASRGSWRNVARAQTMVEVAIVFPLLVVVALALVEFSIYYHAHNVVEAAVQEGARVASRRNASVDEGEGRTNDIIDAGLSHNAIHVQVHGQQLHQGQDDESVEVTADGSVPTFIPWFHVGRGPGHLDLPIHVRAEVSKERFRGGR